MQLMAARNIGALLVLQDGKLAGIFTERDYSRKAYLLDKFAKDIRVNELMTPQVAYVSPDYTAEDCMALVTEMRVRHLPVLENNDVVGLVSIGDLVKDAISGQQFIIDELERYIYGSADRIRQNSGALVDCCRFHPVMEDPEPNVVPPASDHTPSARTKRREPAHLSHIDTARKRLADPDCGGISQHHTEGGSQYNRL